MPASWTTANKSTPNGATIQIGNPIGLLLVLTYAEQHISTLTWTPQTKNSSTFTNQAKN